MMIDDLLKGTENRETEFKEKQNSALFKTLSAFANTNGGVVLIGISDAKKVVGCRCSNADLKELTDTIVNKLCIHPVIEPLDCDGKTVIRIDVKKSRVPVAYEGRYYTRVGNTSRAMDIEELKEFILLGIEWDTLPSSHGFTDIDPETVKLFTRLAKRADRLHVADENEPAEAVLRRLGLLAGEQLTNAAFLLFGKKQERYVSDAVLRIGRFRNGATIIGDRWIDGNLFRQFAEGEEALKSFINVRYEISGESPERKEHWDYPLPALREALMNALVHRDYFRTNEQIMVKVYDDAIWFHNPGGLPRGLSIESLMKNPRSVPRNPLIARVFYLAGYIEQYGSGIQRILSAFSGARLPAPEFSADAWGFTLTMRRDILTPEYLAGLGLNERQITAISHIRNQGSITKREYQDLTSVSTRTALYDLTALLRKGVLVRTGAGKSARYVLSFRPVKMQSDTPTGGAGDA